VNELLSSIGADSQSEEIKVILDNPYGANFIFRKL